MQRTLNEPERQQLLQIAHQAIAGALDGKALAPEMEALPERLQAPGASFVTLTLHGQLRGCIGSLSAYRPLGQDVYHNAIAAAFDDPRFPPLAAAEAVLIRIEISVLTAPRPLAYTSPDDLLRKLRPGIDGVVLERGWNRATFLPQVWEQLPDPEEFLTHLCRKGGLPANAWRWPDLQVSIYQVEKFYE